MAEIQESLSILEFIRELMEDGPLRAWFQDNPEAALAAHGLEDLSASDVQDALVLIDDGEITDFSREYDSRPSIDFSAADWGSGRDRDGDDDHHEAVAQLSRFVTNNFVLDGDTIVDNSVNQDIDTGGGDLEQDFDIDQTLASGDGAVAAGGDVRGNDITSGDGNVVGDGNISGDGNAVGDGNTVLSGDGNAAAFGSGDVNDISLEDVDVDDGGAVSTGNGTAIGSSTTANSFNDTETTNTTTTDIEDSFNDSVEIDTDTTTETTTSNDFRSDDDLVVRLGSGNDLDT